MAEPEQHHLPIVVGVDGSPASVAALRWAYREAVGLHAPLQVMTAWPSSSHEGGEIATEADAQAVAVHAALDALPAEHGTKVSLSWCEGSPDDVLLWQSRFARLIVVGPHGHHSLGEHVLGSVTERLVTEASCPVAVVAADAGDGSARHRIVAGVDGSPPSLVALRWAAARARRTASTVDALLAWEWHAEYTVHPYGTDERHQRARAEATLAHAVAAVPEPLRAAVHGRPVHGSPTNVLVDAAAGADLVVVGNRRRGRVASHVAGSVSHAVARHAGIPVVVVHAVDPGDAVVP